MRISFFVRRVGPYHNARFEAAGRRAELTVVETRPSSNEYPWTTATAARTYRLVSLGRTDQPEIGLRGAALTRAVAQCLEERQPDVVACTGWADPEYHCVLRRCAAEKMPAIAMSDSTLADEPRRWWKELLKRRLVASYTAAIVAGTRSREYLRALGFPDAGIFEPWDVVDNTHIEDAVSRARADAAGCRRRLAMPRPFFLCVSRYLPKKNLFGLLEAYGRYRARHGGEAWDLVILGSGELETRLQSAIAEAQLAPFVHLPGFVQYDRLPEFYAMAGACILPSLSDQWGLVVNEAMAAGLPVVVSTACGCSPDLVVEGENGLTFDPRDAAALSDALFSIATVPEAERQRMGEAGRARIAKYAPEQFADALLSAAAHARQTRRVASWRSRAVLAALAFR